jgi:uncharacterized DUF497 family protein
MRFEWDRDKAEHNLRAHGVPFEEASTVFFGSLSVTGCDPDHSLGERRYVIFGQSAAGRFLVVAHTERDDRVRIITAREGTRSERKLYEKG